MKLASLFGTVATLATLALACTTETLVKTVPASDAGSTDDAGDPSDNPHAESDAATPAADAAKGDGTIGTRSDKGNKSVDVNFSSHGSYDCGTVCTAAGGSCKVGGGNGVGWVDRKYNDGSGTFGNRVSSCDQSESYNSGNTTMTSMTCYCSDMPVPPTVRVRKAEGLYACSKVCTSWSLKCSKSRKHYSFGDEEESSSELLADCDAVPDSATHHYTCACDL